MACAQSFVEGARITSSGRLYRDRQNSTGVEVDRMLGFMGQMRTPVLHLCDLCIRIMRVGPVVVGPLLRPFAIQLRQLFPSRGFNARFPRQTLEKLLVRFSAVPPH